MAPPLWLVAPLSVLMSRIGASLPNEGCWGLASLTVNRLIWLWVPVAHGGPAAAYRADVTNPQASPLTEERFALSAAGSGDTLVWMQNAEPISLFCGDESDGESLRGCTQVMESLYAYKLNETGLEPALAESCDPNEDLTVWTCHLRQGVTFHDGTPFDANDVVATFTMGLDASSPLHQGNTNQWEYYGYLWGLINVPPA